MKKFSNLLIALALSVSAFSANAFNGDRKDFRDETIYFAMTTRFYDGDPTNNVCSWDKQEVQKSKNDPDWRGDFKGLIDKLDYIKALGFTCIWITPVVQNASGEDYHGYHAMDFSKVDLRYESRKKWGAQKDVKFQDLIDAAHAKGIKIVLDVVLQHTGNFGEARLNPLFRRSENIKDQAKASAALIPNTERLSSNYFDQDPDAQYAERWKYFKQAQYEPHNYYHHYGTGWNWDLPNRWWGQIAGDCVDLNTENNTVAQYIVDCYANFIKMGVDGFRIDTTGHIARLTFNKQFIPQFQAIAEQYRDKRLYGGDFFMFGECCARFGSVIYRNQHNLSSHFYTWKSSQNLLDQYDGSQSFWDSQVLNEGHDSPVGPMILCEQETQFNENSRNVFMQNGAWHEPDYSKYSGLSVIDFPMHYNFNNAASAINIAKEGDHYYNDASYNVVYVDSHDYCPGPNDGTRFNGGTEQWAENLSLMFTFRGIPCIYYGSEVEFKAGKPIDVGGVNNKTPRSESGRAYFGTFLEGDVQASDFGSFTANGNVAKTLNADLAQHIIRLNQIRAQVPALRRGQYTFDGCSANGGFAFKRAYKNESYALVAINGGATFTSVPNGNYTDVVTGKQYSVSSESVTVAAPGGKGQLRILVKDWKGGKIGTDGKFIYDTTPVAKGGKVNFTDPGTTSYYTAEDAVGQGKVIFSPAGSSFKSETITVSVKLNEVATSGWFQVGNNARVNLSPNQTEQFTIGEGMNFGESITVTWGTDDMTGKETYRKVDPNAVTTIYVTGKDGSDISGTNIYAWNAAGAKLAGNWPGVKLSGTKDIDNRTFYYYTFDTSDPINIIFSRNGNQTADITNIVGDTYFEYDGAKMATKIEVNPGPSAPRIYASPADGTQFVDPIQVTLSASPAVDIYYTLDGSPASAASTRYAGPITISASTTINAYAANEIGETRRSFKYTKVNTITPEEFHVYYDNSETRWGDVYVYCWDNNNSGGNAFSGAWPGAKLSETVSYNGKQLLHWSFKPQQQLASPKIIFSNGNGEQTSDLMFENMGIYNRKGKYDIFSSGIGTIANSDFRVFAADGRLVVIAPADCLIKVVGIDGSVSTLPATAGYNYYSLPKGFYIVAGRKILI